MIYQLYLPFQDSLVISHTSINSGPPGSGGIKTPNTPHLTISNVTFVNFDNSSTSCLKACSHCKVRQGGFQVSIQLTQDKQLQRLSLVTGRLSVAPNKGWSNYLYMYPSCHADKCLMFIEAVYISLGLVLKPQISGQLFTAQNILQMGTRSQSILSLSLYCHSIFVFSFSPFLIFTPSLIQ